MIDFEPELGKRAQISQVAQSCIRDARILQRDDRDACGVIQWLQIIVCYRKPIEYHFGSTVDELLNDARTEVANLELLSKCGL